MHLQKNFSLSVLVIGALSFSLTACGTGGGDDDPSVDATGAPNSVEVTYMLPQGSIDPSVFKLFAEQYPDITLTLQEVPVAAYKQQVRSLTQTGDLPDVIALPGGPDGELLVQAGVPLDLAEALDTPPADGEGTWRETFSEGRLEEASRTFLTQDQYADGQQWFVPQSLLAVAAVYNVDIFKEVGIEPPTDWETFQSNNEKLVEAGYTPMSFNGAQNPDWWPKMVWDQTARDVTREQIESGEVTFSDPKLVEGLATVAAMHAAGTFPDGAMSNGLEEEQALFLSGATAQFVHVPSSAQYIAANAPFPVAAFVLPGARGVDPVRPVGGTTSNLVVNAESENQEAAIDVVKFMTSEELYNSQVDNYMLSPLAAPVEGGDEIYQVYADAIAGGSAVPQTWFQSFDPENYDELNTQVYPGVFSGEISPEEAAARIDELFSAADL